jgi:hypothetical protein
LEGLKGLTEEGQALEAQAADQVGDGKMVEALAQDSKIHEEEDSSLALEELVEGQEEELEALLMEDNLEPTVDDLLEVWVVEGDLETLEMEDGQVALEMVEGLEALETEDDLEPLEMEEGQESLEMEEGQESLEMEDDLEALEMEEGQEALEAEDDQEALEMEDELEVLEMEEGRVVLAMEEDQEALALEDEAEVKAEALEYRVALVAGTAWAVVLGSVILTPGEAKKCRALAAE